MTRLLRTVRHLRAEQIAYQLRYRLGGGGGRPAAGEVPAVPDPRWVRRAFLAPPAGRNVADRLRAGRFEFLNRQIEAGWPPDWRAGRDDKLWQYHLHYFEWLWLLADEDGRVAVDDWVAHCTPQLVPGAWEPYPVSLRLINWLGWLVAEGRGGGMSASRWASIFRQVEWLRRRVERHLGANHLLENAAALCLAGSAFTGRAAAAWLSDGLELLRRELPEQFPGDGLHFERSPMYHLRATYLLELLCRWGVPEVAELASAPRRRARVALARVCHPDGGIALLNDSAFGVYHEPEALWDAAAARATGPFALPDAGYYGLRDGAGNYVVCDAGRLGPDVVDRGPGGEDPRAAARRGGLGHGRSRAIRAGAGRRDDSLTLRRRRCDGHGRAAWQYPPAPTPDGVPATAIPAPPAPASGRTSRPAPPG